MGEVGVRGGCLSWQTSKSKSEEGIYYSESCFADEKPL